MKRTLIAALILTGSVVHGQQAPSVLASVRRAVAQGNLQLGEQLVAGSRAAHGVTPEMLEALSWLGRGALAASQPDKAAAYAQQTYDLAVAELKRRPVDREPHLPAALGAALEVLAQTTAGRGARTEAVAFLRRELSKYKDTSIHKRIQKNINLLSLEGTAAPDISLSDALGTQPRPPAKGSPKLVFFWAHWCSDCKAQGPVIERLLARYGAQGLSVIAPTERFGYVAGGRPAGPQEETDYIAQVQRTSYPWMTTVSVPLNEANHKRYGVSTTPTLVLIDRNGLIRLYHPGRMTEAELEPLVQRVVGPPAGRGRASGAGFSSSPRFVTHTSSPLDVVTP